MACRTRLPCCFLHNRAPLHFPLFPSSRPPLTTSSHADYTCADPSNSSFGPLPETTSPTGYELNNRVEDNSMVIKLMFFHKPSMTSTYDTSESIATRPPESDLDDDPIQNMLASPLYFFEREASADRSLVYHSFRQNSLSSSSRFRASAERPAAVFSHERKSSQESHSDRDGIPLAHGAVQGENEASSRPSESENDTG